MQFHLETDELDLLANVLMERIGAMAAEAVSAGPPKSNLGLAPDPQQCDDLLDRVLARDLKFDPDELEYMADLLTAKKRSLHDEIARQPSSGLKADLQKQLALVERVLERVNELFVMI